VQQNFSEEPSIEDVHSRGRGVFVHCGHFTDKGGLQITGFFDGHTFWCKKNWIFRNLWCVRTDGEGGRGLGQCGEGGWGLFFAILCGRPLWTAPKEGA